MAAITSKRPPVRKPQERDVPHGINREVYLSAVGYQENGEPGQLREKVPEAGKQGVGTNPEKVPDSLDDDLPTDAEILAAVAKSKDLALVSGDELLSAIDATRVAGMATEHDIDLVRWELCEGGEV